MFRSVLRLFVSDSVGSFCFSIEKTILVKNCIQGGVVRALKTDGVQWFKLTQYYLLVKAILHMINYKCRQYLRGSAH